MPGYYSDADDVWLIESNTGVKPLAAVAGPLTRIAREREIVAYGPVTKVERERELRSFTGTAIMAL